jgi:hypothetical protein
MVVGRRKSSTRSTTASNEEDRAAIRCFCFTFHHAESAEGIWNRDLDLAAVEPLLFLSSEEEKDSKCECTYYSHVTLYSISYSNIDCPYIICEIIDKT